MLEYVVVSMTYLVTYVLLMYYHKGWSVYTRDMHLLVLVPHYTVDIDGIFLVSDLESPPYQWLTHDGADLYTCLTGIADKKLCIFGMLPDSNVWFSAKILVFHLGFLSVSATAPTPLLLEKIAF